MVGLNIILVAAALWVLFWVLGIIWVIVLPVLFALILCTVLWPPTGLLRRWGMPPALASLLVMLLGIGVIGGVISLIVPSVVNQVPDLAARATEGVRSLQEWVQGPPINLRDEQLDNMVHAVTERLQSSATTIASGVFTGLGTATSILVTLFTTIVLVFFFLKDGPRFVPWIKRTMGQPSGEHLGEVLTRVWNTLGGFIRTQAIVSAVDATLIGAGLFILQVPLAGVLIIITFIGGFIPIVGAFVAGALAVLIALVSNNFTTALIVLAIIIAVQQIEGNVLQPWLQAKSMDLHAVIVLLSVTLGGTLFGITGAFLAVPAVSGLAVVLRYINEQIALRAGEEDELPDSGEPDDNKDDGKAGRKKRGRKRKVKAARADGLDSGADGPGPEPVGGA